MNYSIPFFSLSLALSSLAVADVFVFQQDAEITLNGSGTGSFYSSTQDTRLLSSSPDTNYGSDTSDHEIDGDPAKHSAGQGRER